MKLNQDIQCQLYKVPSMADCSFNTTNFVGAADQAKTDNPPRIGYFGRMNCTSLAKASFRKVSFTRSSSPKSGCVSYLHLLTGDAGVGVLLLGNAMSPNHEYMQFRVHALTNLEQHPTCSLALNPKPPKLPVPTPKSQIGQATQPMFEMVSSCRM